ncbi:DUF4157 domain-containing protein [Streptomyces sp. NPDC058301]|uniref:eCIS core domain-containing protein n=1 Tax=Streptomyces sp. NPDC058301 TaxID=3346436 RepID=UPI0036EDC44B
MHAHEKHPEKQEGKPGTGVRRRSSVSRGVDQGPTSAVRASARQRSGGQSRGRAPAQGGAARPRRRLRARSHGRGEGRRGRATGERAGRPCGAAQRRVNSPSQPIADPVRKEAEAFYQTDLSPARVHSDTVAQRATAAMGAEAMTIGHHIFLPPQAARKKEIVGHELSHVSDNLSGFASRRPRREPGAAWNSGTRCRRR